MVFTLIFICACMLHRHNWALDPIYRLSIHYIYNLANKLYGSICM
uniref:Uncharacterized protein n=1 Tax=Arundo donax TaxID=35708 RepID=A0A0A9B8M4_ARUDO